MSGHLFAALCYVLSAVNWAVFFKNKLLFFFLLQLVFIKPFGLSLFRKTSETVYHFYTFSWSECIRRHSFTEKPQLIYGNSLKTLKLNCESFPLDASKACGGVEVWLLLVLTSPLVSTMKATVCYYCCMLHQTCSVEGRLKITKKIF